MLRKPERLCPGDVIGIVAPASAPPDPKAIDVSVQTIEALGFKALLGSNVRARLGFLAGNDRQRAADLMGMFRNPKVKAIFCIRGGYGTSRLLDRLSFAEIKRHPKILVGYSDITSLHCALLAHARLVCFHGPMLNSDLNKPDLPDYTRSSLLRSVTQSHPGGSIRQGYTGDSIQVIRSGRASGRLMGGNLSLLCSTMGTPVQPAFKGSILFLEDLDEKPYRFDRMLTHLLNGGALQQVSGIAVGINAGCDDRAQAGEYRQSLEDVLRERLLPLKVPVVSGLPFGHIPHNATLPLGVKATLDGRNGDLIIEEAAVE